VFSPDRQVWRGLLGETAARTLAAGFCSEGCRDGEWERDELGQRRPLDGAFLACVLGLERGQTRTIAGAIRLWEIAAEPQDGKAVEGLVRAGTGPLLWNGDEGTIETSTEEELSGLHAAWRIAARRGDELLKARCLEAASWAVTELQPDNATNRPWGVHVFAELWMSRGDTGAALYAQTLLHNCQVMFGRPDRVSAVVLWDAAMELARGA